MLHGRVRQKEQTNGIERSELVIEARNSPPFPFLIRITRPKVAADGAVSFRLERAVARIVYNHERQDSGPAC